MENRTMRLSVIVMAVMLVVSLALNAICLNNPPPPSSNALFLFRDADFLSMWRTGAVVGFLPDQGPLPDGWVPIEGQRIERRQYPALYKVVKNNLGLSGNEESVTLPDYRGLAVTTLIGVEGTDAKLKWHPWFSSGWIGHLATTLVPREMQASPPGHVVGLTPIVWAIKT